jgi:phage shock protein A
MKDILVALMSVVVGGILSHLFTRRKYKIEVENAEIDVTRKIVDLYKQAVDDMQKELSMAREEIAKLRHEVEMLTKLNRKLEGELKEVKKLQERANDNNTTIR